LPASVGSPRELATRFTDVESYFVSESSVYRLLKAHDLITSPAFIVIKAADEFKDKTTAPNQLWQTTNTLRTVPDNSLDTSTVFVGCTDPVAVMMTVRSTRFAGSTTKLC